jgi:hypothetical protein
MEEQWKTIYLNDEKTQYEVSNFGRVKSLRFNKEKILKAGIKNHGYALVILYHKSKRYTKDCHRLVAKYFLDNFDESLEVNHKDFNTQNNIVTNLEMVTTQQNRTHKKLANRKSNLKKGYLLTEEQVRDIRKKELTINGYAKKYSINVGSIYNIMSYKNYKWVK